jgi:hypothetical protein
VLNTIKALTESLERREAFCHMPNLESDERAGIDVDPEQHSNSVAEPPLNNVYEMTWFQTGVIIDNGGGEMSALND